MGSRDDLLAEHGSMVERVALALRAELELDVDLRDLKNDGLIGLLEAAERFDPSRGSELGAFAYQRVRGAMIDGLRRMGRLPRRAHDRCKRTGAMCQTLQHEAEVRTEEGAPGGLAADSGAAEPDREAYALAFDEMMSRVAATFVATAMAQQEGRANPEEALMTELENASLRRALGGLGERDAQVIRGVFFDELTHAELAAALEVERSTVSKICAKALSELRDRLG